MPNLQYETGMLRCFLAMYLFVLCLFSLPVQASERVLIFAAASQRDALLEIGSLYEKQCVCKLVYSFAATSTLARQIDAGAPADIFISANTAWVDWLEIRDGLIGNSRKTIAGNRLVVASASAQSKGYKANGYEVLLDGKFAMADPISVPAGIYAREALETLDIWEDARPNAVFTENVRIALASIRRGDLLSGIVYASDLKASPGLATHFVFPEESHTPVQYVAAAVREGKKIKDFMEFLTTSPVQQVFVQTGFLPLADMKN